MRQGRQSADKNEDLASATPANKIMMAMNVSLRKKAIE